MFTSYQNDQIVIDPRSSYAYGSFYLLGLRHIFGKRNICFSRKPFKDLDDPGWNFRFVAIRKGIETKFFIHTNDFWQISKPDYDWCDIYGHVNANFSHTPHEDFPKIISLVPSFGIRALSNIDALKMAMRMFLCAAPDICHRETWNKYKNCMERNIADNIKHHFGKIYRTQTSRLEYSLYNNEVSSLDDYIFFCSTLWYDHPDNQNDAGVNLRRANFMRVCKSIPYLNFEGGFVADTTSSKEKFADLLTHSCSMEEWLEKTKRSSFVFNTPAFWDCHGWKLGEYLALGKCIISTPLSNDLPSPLVHGKHIHIVDPSQESIKEAIEYIYSHPEYRHELEKNAKEYWETYGTPQASLKLLGL